MRDRPIGDDIDQKLRIAMTDLADISPPLPEFDDLGKHAVLIDEQQRAPRDRRPLFALAFATVITIGGLLAVSFDDDDAKLELAGEREDASAQLWSGYVEEADETQVQRCLAEWITNRDINFRIEGDQFNASSEVSEFFVSSDNAANWTTRHLAALRLAASIEGDSSPKSALIEQLELLDRGLGSNDQIDIAPALNTGAANFDAIFDSSADCPLGPAADRSPLQLELEAYGLEQEDPIALSTAIRCADAALVVHVNEAAIAMPSVEAADRLSLAIKVAESGDAIARDQSLRDFVAAHAASPPDTAELQDRAANLRDSVSSTYPGCPLF